ncbi:hypothetical protein [Merismopedia glauca]|uniref:Uncharacterized protein n=1 Tax=Merismopedia glauca CCAP 1448/3 TaxID=1296344 RepID=A0A2T1C602_9CYAN|nr:hypothetical protein [Merismopedia glauca]PSB03578.1 hypothetical protein C7B64_07975 [Merismopedia glauca CCAP 1448/3]
MKNTLLKATLISLISGVGIDSLISPVTAQSYRLQSSESAILIAQSTPDTPPQPPLVTPNNSISPSLLTPQIEISKIEIEMLSEGDEPKQKLRFKVPINSKETAILVMKMDSNNTLAGNPIPQVKLPINVVEMEMQVTKVDANGDMHVKFTYPNVQVVVTDEQVSPEVVRLMRTLMPKLSSVQGEFVIDERGQTKVSKFSLPSENDPLSQQLSSQLTNSFNQLSSPIPELAIGKGAKWRTNNYVKVNGISIKQIANYHLTDIRNGVATIDIKIEQNGEPQAINLPGLPPELVVKLRSFKTQGQGRMKLSFERLLPLSSTALLTSSGEMSVKIPGSDKELTTQIDTSMNMSIRSQPATIK